MGKWFKNLKFKRFIQKRQKGNTRLEEAVKLGLISPEEQYRLRYERAKEDYKEFLRSQRKKKK